MGKVVNFTNTTTKGKKLKTKEGMLKMTEEIRMTEENQRIENAGVDLYETAILMENDDVPFSEMLKKYKYDEELAKELEKYYI